MVNKCFFAFVIFRTSTAALPLLARVFKLCFHLLFRSGIFRLTDRTLSPMPAKGEWEINHPAQAGSLAEDTANAMPTTSRADLESPELPPVCRSVSPGRPSLAYQQAAPEHHTHPSQHQLLLWCLERGIHPPPCQLGRASMAERASRAQ